MNEVLEKIKTLLDQSPVPLSTSYLADQVELLEPAIIKATGILISRGEVFEIEPGMYSITEAAPVVEDGESPIMEEVTSLGYVPEGVYPEFSNEAGGETGEIIELPEIESESALDGQSFDEEPHALSCPRCSGYHLTEITNNSCARRGAFLMSNGATGYTLINQPEIVREIKVKGYTCEICRARLKFNNGTLVMYGEDPVAETEIAGFINIAAHETYQDAVTALCYIVNMSTSATKVTPAEANGIPGFLVADRIVAPEVANTLFAQHLEESITGNLLS